MTPPMTRPGMALFTRVVDLVVKLDVIDKYLGNTPVTQSMSSDDWEWEFYEAAVEFSVACDKYMYARELYESYGTED